jgi:hypothetical protein
MDLTLILDRLDQIEKGLADHGDHAAAGGRLKMQRNTAGKAYTSAADFLVCWLPAQAR